MLDVHGLHSSGRVAALAPCGHPLAHRPRGALAGKLRFEDLPEEVGLLRLWSVVREALACSGHLFVCHLGLCEGLQPINPPIAHPVAVRKGKKNNIYTQLTFFFVMKKKKNKLTLHVCVYRECV